jgi:UDP-glucose:(heptosyl)LPS alpha-1,3-glucosyltransferase
VRLGVLLDRYDAARGGAEAHTDALVRRALGTGDEVVVAALAGTVPEGATLRLVRAPRRRPARDRVFARAGDAALREAGCDVVLAVRHAPRCDVYLPHGGLVADALSARDAARGRPPGLRGVLRALSPKVRWFLEAERAVLDAPEGPVVVCVSRALAARAKALHPACARRLRVVPNGVDAARFDPVAFASQRAALRASRGLEDAYVGLLLAHDLLLKGAHVAVAALAHEAVRALAPPFHLVLAGDRPSRDLRRLARRLGVADRMHAVGALDDARGWLAAADVLVHPTFHDPCSLACLEALAMALPVITTPRNGVRELMGMRGGIVLEEAGNPEALAVAVRVLADPTLRAHTAEDARWIALRNRLSTRLDEVLDVCRTAAAAGGGGRGG